MMLCFYACSLIVYSLFSVAIHTPKENSFGQHYHWFSYGHSFWISVDVVSLLMESLGYYAQNWWLPYQGISVAFWLLMVHASMLLELNGVITKMGCSLGNRMGKFFLGDDDLCHDPNFTRIETTCCPIREWCTSPPDLFSNLNSRSQAWTVHYLGSISVSRHDTDKEVVQDSLLSHIISFTYPPPSFSFLHGYARPPENLCKTSHQSLPLSNPNFLNPTISPTFTPAKLTTFPSFNFKPILLTHLFMTAMSVWHYATYNNLQEIWI